VAVPTQAVPPVTLALVPTSCTGQFVLVSGETSPPEVNGAIETELLHEPTIDTASVTMPLGTPYEPFEVTANTDAVVTWHCAVESAEVQSVPCISDRCWTAQLCHVL
jgi:hypothetical protein